MGRELIRGVGTHLACIGFLRIGGCEIIILCVTAIVIWHSMGYSIS